MTPTERTRQWRLENPERVISTRKRYYLENKEQIKNNARIYGREHKSQISARGKQYRLDNLVKIRTREKQSKLRKPENYLFYSAKRRAIKRGLEFSITIDDIKIPNYCPVLGLVLHSGTGKFSHNSPSIDRVDSTKGYTKENIIVVSFRANNLKSDATSIELKKLAEFYCPKMEQQNGE